VKRKLVLKKETVSALTTTELEGVAGAQAITPACPTNYCYPTWNTCALSRLIDPCVTG